MEDLLLEYRYLGASDLHIRANKYLCYRKEGELFVTQRLVLEEEILEFLKKINLLDSLEKERSKEIDFSFQDSAGRYRMNLCQGEEGYFLTLRIVRDFLPEFPKEIHRIFEDISQETHGLVLVTGSTGSGKSTTLRFFLEEYNKRYSKKIVCLEDPVEYCYQEKKSIFFQREIGRDSKSFTTAIRSALRQDPDILLIGEIRDEESLDAALYFAESGHLVLSSLHTQNCVESIHKILALSSQEKEKELRQRLSHGLRWMIAQELIKTKDGKQVAIYEILKNTKAVANMIVSGRELQLPSVVASSSEEGMCSKEQNKEKYREEIDKN